MMPRLRLLAFVALAGIPFAFGAFLPALTPLGVLATVGSTAPFVGLLGTVMGILSAFSEIAAKGNATIATVAAPIGNALLATSAGLFAAIPAVVAYNAFVSRVRIFDHEMSNFSSDFLNIVKRHYRGR